jgi:RNA polymerase subunit RPABC4/transcription elongation factor Spt4
MTDNEAACSECAKLDEDDECHACRADRIARNAGMRLAPWRVIDTERGIGAFVERAGGGGWMWLGRRGRESTEPWLASPWPHMERHEAIAAALRWFGEQN